MPTYTYIIYFDRPIKNKQFGDSYHYIGFSDDIEHRLKVHYSGRGSNVTRYAFRNKISMTLSTVFEGNFEKRITLWFKLYCQCERCKSYRNKVLSLDIVVYDLPIVWDKQYGDNPKEKVWNNFKREVA